MRFLACTIGLALALSSCVTPVPVAHVGPVTAITHDGAFACSQAGVEGPSGFFVPRTRPWCVEHHGGQVLVGGGQPGVRGAVALHDARGRERAFRTIGDDLVYCLAMHPHGYAVVGLASGAVEKLLLPSLESAGRLLPHSAPCRAIALSSDGAELATAGLDGIVRVYDTSTWQPREFGDHTDGVACLLWTAEGLWSGARDGRIRLHRGERLIRSYPAQHEPVVGLCEHGGRVFAALRDGRILDIDRNRSRVAPAGRGLPAFCLASDGEALLVGTSAQVRRHRAGT